MSYLGSPFHEFWSRCDESHIHPDDKPFFAADERLVGTLIAGRPREVATFQTESYVPCPFDGPLNSARVVVCLANPKYSETDAQHAELILKQREGDAPLPMEFDWYYESRIARPIGIAMDGLRNLVSLFNVCPYASTNMEGAEVRLAAGLPSVWAAQKHLREVLLPLAVKDEIFIVIGRKHQLWGVHEGFSSPNIVVTRENAINGRIPNELGAGIRQWLGSKQLLPRFA